MADAKVYINKAEKDAYLDGLENGLRDALNQANTHAALLDALGEPDAEGAYSVADVLYADYMERKSIYSQARQSEVPFVSPAR